MTNKDNASKAREIANEFANENVRPAIRIAAEEMADWKDQQFKEHLSNAVKAYKCRGEAFFDSEITAIEKITEGFFGGEEYENTHTSHPKEKECSAKMYMEEMMGAVSESVKTEWREFSYIASELHRRRIETIINPERGDIQLRDEKTGKTLIFGSLFEVKAFALGLDWGVKNAMDMDLRGLRSSICKEEWK